MGNKFCLKSLLDSYATHVTHGIVLLFNNNKLRMIIFVDCYYISDECHELYFF